MRYLEFRELSGKKVCVVKIKAFSAQFICGVAAYCLSAVLVPSAFAAKLNGSWAYVTDDGVQRYDATLTQFRNGSVLITSGTSYNTEYGVLADTEIFNPDTNIWTKTAPLLVGRTMPVAALLKNGTVLVASGTTNAFNAAPTGEAEIYDPAKNTWTTTGSMATPRFNAEVASLQNGQVMVCGGTPDAIEVLSSCELYNPKSGTWTATASTHYPRRYSSMVVLPDGDVLNVGDQAPSELYSVKTGAWSLTGAQPYISLGGTLTLLRNGTVFAAPSEAASTEPGQIYTPSSNTWTAVASGLGRVYNQALRLPGNKVMLLGGCSDNCSDEDLNTTSIYNVKTNSWSDGPTMKAGRMWFNVARFKDGRILALGSHNGQGPEMYTP
jgi:N-acetylneuraminic acid mutarotase